MHLSKVSEVCSNQVCMTYFHQIMQMSFLGSLVRNIGPTFLQCINYYMSNQIIDFSLTAAWICFTFCVDVSWIDLYQDCLNEGGGVLPLF